MKPTQLINNGTKLAQQRIYVNSFTQRILGNDVQYTVDLGRPFEIKQSIQLDQCVMENLFGNFYQSQKGDYRDLTIIDQTGAYIRIFVDQYLSSEAALVAFLTAKDPLGNWILVPAGNTYQYNITLRRISKVTGQNDPFRTYGYGWTKLGFEQQTAADPATATHVGSNFCDLSQPSAFLISIDNLPFSISSGKGSAAFMVPNTSSFGAKNIYTNTQQQTCQTIYVQNPVTIQQLNITIQGCDQMPLNTVKANNADINQTNSEHIFLLTIQ